MKAKIWAIVKALCWQEQTWCKFWREGERKIHKTPQPHRPGISIIRKCIWWWERERQLEPQAWQTCFHSSAVSPVAQW